MIKKYFSIGIFFLTRYGYLVCRNNYLDDPQANQPRPAWHIVKNPCILPDSDTCSQRASCCPGQWVGFGGQNVFFATPITICFGVGGASEIVLGAKNLFSGCLTPVPLDRFLKNIFFHFDFFLQNFRFSVFQIFHF